MTSLRKIKKQRKRAIGDPLVDLRDKTLMVCPVCNQLCVNTDYAKTYGFCSVGCGYEFFGLSPYDFI